MLCPRLPLPVNLNIHFGMVFVDVVQVLARKTQRNAPLAGGIIVERKRRA